MSTNASPADAPARAASPQRVLVVLCVAELLAMSLWFTGTSAIPQLAERWQAGLGSVAWLTMAVQLGFVTGALAIATFNLPDILPAPRIFVLSAIAAAAANAGFAAVAEEQASLAIALRFLTGMFLAGVYPTGMIILAGWFRQGRGLALGLLIGALTIGSALPHGINAFSTVSWKPAVLTSSALAVVAAALVALFVTEGPYTAPSPRLDLSQVGAVFRNRRLRLANLGYLGHMWELYSMWGWIGVLLAAAPGAGATPTIRLATFAVVAIGFIGCVWAGKVSDNAPGGAGHSNRVRQRSKVTIVAMAVSGLCCIVAALVFESFPLLVAVALVWGIAVIADSAQFSAIVSEVSDQNYVGTALALQTALGFLLTVFALRATALIADDFGWRWAAASMAIGPALGIIAMWRLMARPEDGR